MRYVLVLVLSLASGGVVYFITLRTGERQQLAGLGFGSPAPARSRSPESASPSLLEDEADQPSGGTIADARIVEDAPIAPARAGPGYTYLRVATSGPSVRERLQGFVGLIVLISVSAALLALAAYQTGHFINQTMKHFLK